MEENKSRLQGSEDLKKPENKEKKPASTPNPPDKKKLTVIIAAAAVAVVALVLLLVILLGNGGKALTLDDYYYCESADASVRFNSDNSFSAILYGADSYKIVEGNYEIKGKKISFTPNGGEKKTYSFESLNSGVKIDGKLLAVEEGFVGTYYLQLPENSILYNFKGRHLELFIGAEKVEGVFTIKGETLITYINTDSMPENMFVTAGKQENGFSIGDGFVVINGVKLNKMN